MRMFGLLYGLYELYFRPIQYQLLLIGLDDAGTTHSTISPSKIQNICVTIS